jgi:sec-independent protein translocase protein TatC
MTAETTKTPETPETSPPGPTPDKDVRMTIWEHLAELRGRIVKAAIALGIGAVGAWSFRIQILDWLIKPYEAAWKKHFTTPLELQTLAPADAFLGYLQLSIVTGAIAAAPVVFYQLWSFISPGLYKKERRLIVPFVLFSTTLFLSGVAFAYYVAFPFTFNYFLSLVGELDTAGTVLTQKVTLGFFLDFTTRFLLAFGCVFELPLFIAFLVIAGLVTPRQLVKFSRWAVLLAFIVGAIVTPGPEVTSQLAVSGALIGLYFFSILIAFALKPRAKKEDTAA